MFNRFMLLSLSLLGTNFLSAADSSAPAHDNQYLVISHINETKQKHVYVPLSSYNESNPNIYGLRTEDGNPIFGAFYRPVSVKTLEAIDTVNLENGNKRLNVSALKCTSISKKSYKDLHKGFADLPRKVAKYEKKTSKN